MRPESGAGSTVTEGFAPRWIKLLAAATHTTIVAMTIVIALVITRRHWLATTTERSER